MEGTKILSGTMRLIDGLISLSAPFPNHYKYLTRWTKGQLAIYSTEPYHVS